jgi:hypothetical protein
VKEKTKSDKGRGRQAAATAATAIVSMMVMEFPNIAPCTSRMDLVKSAEFVGGDFNSMQVERLLKNFNQVHRVKEKTPLVLVRQDKQEGGTIVCHQIVTDENGDPQLVPFDGRITRDYCLISQVTEGGIPI